MFPWIKFDWWNVKWDEMALVNLFTISSIKQMDGLQWNPYWVSHWGNEFRSREMVCWTHFQNPPVRPESIQLFASTLLATSTSGKLELWLVFGTLHPEPVMRFYHSVVCSLTDSHQKGKGQQQASHKNNQLENPKSLSTFMCPLSYSCWNIGLWLYYLSKEK